MDEVLELAQKLSTAIARSDRFTSLRTAEKAVMEDAEAVGKIQARDELIKKVAEKERNQQPVEPGEKRELAELDEYVKTSPTLSDLFRRQADFQEMMNLVNQRISSALEPEESKSEGGGEEAPSGEGAG